MQNFIVGCILGISIAYIFHNWVIPNIPENVKNKVKDNIWSFVLAIIILSGVMLFFFLPLAFKYIAINLWDIPTSTIDENGKVTALQLTDLGSLGDIYGSLNTLFTSITLGIVAYTAGLQRKANVHTYNSNQIQINEAKYSNFSNLFYSLLNHKQVNFNNLVIENQDDTFNPNKIFIEISRELSRLCRNDWKNLEKVDKKTINEVFVEFTKVTFGANSHAQIHAYFLVYSDLLDLINRSEISDDNKIFFRRIVSNSMTGPEQITLLWVSAYRNDLNNSLNDSLIFKLFYSEDVLIFSKKFHKISHFSNSNFIENWDK